MRKINIKTDRTNRSFSDESAGPLRTRTAHGIATVFSSMLLQKVISLVLLGVMARLLSPTDYGLFGMVLAMTVFLQIFSDMGLAAATVQKLHLTEAQLSSIFWINLSLGIILGLLTAAIAPLMVLIFHEPVLVPVTLLCSLGFPLAALGSQHRALLQRRMNFTLLSISELCGLIIGSGVGVFMAWRGQGVYALVGQQLSGIGVAVVMNWIFTGWIPGKFVRGCGIRGMLKMGGYLTGFHFVNYFSRNLDKVLLGSFYGAAPLGLYTRGCTLMMFPIGMVSGPLSVVMVPALSKIQNDVERLRNVYLQVLQAIAFVSFPLMVWLMIFSYDVVAVVFGSKWLEVAPLFQLLCIVGIWQGVYNATGQVFLASGRTDRQFKVGVFMAILLVAAFAIGVNWGARGVALAYAIAFSIGVLPYLAYTYATVGLKLRTVLHRLLPALVAALALVPFLWVVESSLFLHWHPALRLVSSFLGACLLYLLFSTMINRAFLINLIEKANAFFPFSWGKPSGKESIL